METSVTSYTPRHMRRPPKLRGVLRWCAPYLIGLAFCYLFLFLGTWAADTWLPKAPADTPLISNVQLPTKGF